MDRGCAKIVGVRAAAVIYIPHGEYIQYTGGTWDVCVGSWDSAAATTKDGRNGTASDTLGRVLLNAPLIP